MVREVKNIKVLSYLRNHLGLACRNREVSFSPSDGRNPTVEYMSFEDIEYVNSRSSVFKKGVLEFEDTYKDEMYDELHIDPSKCLYEREIDKILLNPNEKNIRRIVEITDIQTIERVRGHMAVIYGSVTQDINRVVETRFKEITAGVRTSSIVLEPVKKQGDQVQMLMQQMAEMQKQLNAALENKKESAVTQQTDEPGAAVLNETEEVPVQHEIPVQSEIPVVAETAPKKRGRKPAAK